MEALSPFESGDRIARIMMNNHEVYSSYTTDLGLEGLLYLYDATKKDEYLDHVLKVWKFREYNNSAQLDVNILFTSLHFETYLRTTDTKYISSFVDKAGEFMGTVPRDQDGAVCYPLQPETRRIFIDMLQGYCVFMARAGWLSGDNQFLMEAVNQYQIFRNILRNPETGLWHQGRNWGNDPGQISPGHWNRGQGWVIRGMVDCLDYLPKDTDYHRTMLDLLDEFVADLIKFQDIRGMWHQLTDHEESYPETSGSALIVHHLYKIFHRNWLDSDALLPVAEKGIQALMEFIQDDGTVMNTSHGTGPLSNLEGYLHRPSVPGDPHAAGTMLMALAGPYLARDPKSMV